MNCRLLANASDFTRPICPPLFPPISPSFPALVPALQERGHHFMLSVPCIIWCCARQPQGTQPRTAPETKFGGGEATPRPQYMQQARCTWGHHHTSGAVLSTIVHPGYCIAGLTARDRK